MSGHNKWSTIKHKKGRADAQKSRMWTKLVKEITVAARMGGGDPDGNPRLRSAVDAARAANMPGENVIRAIKRGTGELEGVNYEEGSYEGYGPAGVAYFVEVLTDNKNRTVSEIRHIFGKNNGKMAENGSVAWIFESRGLNVIEAAGVDEDELMMAAMDGGADDYTLVEQVYEVESEPGSTDVVRKALVAAGYAVTESKLIRVPQNTVELDANGARQNLRLIDALEDNDDVKSVWANVEIDDAVLAELAE